MNLQREENHYGQALDSNPFGFFSKSIELKLAKSNHKLTNNTNCTNENNQKEKVGKRQEMSGDTWFLEKKGARHKVRNSDIVFVKSNDNYCQIHTKSGLVFTIRMTIKNMQEWLPKKLFTRVHRQYLVQLDMIDSINFQEGIVKIGESEIPVSRRRRKELGDKVIQI